jgi:hypothetical protein
VQRPSGSGRRVRPLPMFVAHPEPWIPPSVLRVRACHCPVLGVAFLGADGFGEDGVGVLGPGEGFAAVVPCVDLLGRASPWETSGTSMDVRWCVVGWVID